jgi:hypothetical protein
MVSGRSGADRFGSGCRDTADQPRPGKRRRVASSRLLLRCGRWQRTRRGSVLLVSPGPRDEHDNHVRLRVWVGSPYGRQFGRPGSDRSEQGCGDPGGVHGRCRAHLVPDRSSDESAGIHRASAVARSGGRGAARSLRRRRISGCVGAADPRCRFGRADAGRASAVGGGRSGRGVADDRSRRSAGRAGDLLRREGAGGGLRDVVPEHGSAPVARDCAGKGAARLPPARGGAAGDRPGAVQLHPAHAIHVLPHRMRTAKAVEQSDSELSRCARARASRLSVGLPTCPYCTSAPARCSCPTRSTRSSTPGRASSSAPACPAMSSPAAGPATCPPYQDRPRRPS